MLIFFASSYLILFFIYNIILLVRKNPQLKISYVLKGTCFVGVSIVSNTRIKTKCYKYKERFNMSEEEKIEVETVNEVEADTQTAEEDNSVEVETSTEEVVTELPAKKQRSRKKKIETQEVKPESEWKEQVVQIRRVTKVVKGGKKLSFRAIVIVGNQKGQVGVGCAKASEVIIAIQKAIADGRKNLITVPIFKTTIPHPITGRSGAGSVMLRPASQGTGIIAGGAVRSVLELAGIENILSKSLGSKSPLNAANATLEALKALKPFNEVAKRRGLTMSELLN